MNPGDKPTASDRALELDPLLQRQLRKLDLDPASPPSSDLWGQLLLRINETYLRAKDDRELLNRSLELSTAEMAKLNERLSGERDRMEAVVAAIGEAMAVLEETSSRPESTREVTGALSMARRRFGGRLGEIFGNSGSSWENTSLTLATSGTTVTVDSLRRSFTALADRIGRMLSQTAASASLKKELEVAGAVQSMLLPSDALLIEGPLSIAGHCVPASDCGGDWWTAQTLPDERILIAIGDVTGHGIPAAIVTGVAKGACDVAIAARGSSLEPSELLELMNRAICSAGRQQMLMTCQSAIFERTGRAMLLANGGHPFALHVRDRKATPVIAQGSALGSFDGGDFPAVRVEIEPGDLLVWYTDGVVELESPSGEAFGERRLRSLLASLPPLDVRDVRWEIRRALDQFRGDRPAADDTTFVVARLT